MVAEYQRFFIAGVQGNRLHPVFILIRQVVGGGDGLLGDLICSGGNTERNLAIRAGGPIVLIVAVDGLDGEHGAGDGLSAVCVDFGNGQLRFLQILEDYFLLVAAVQADGLRGFVADTVTLSGILGHTRAAFTLDTYTYIAEDFSTVLLPWSGWPYGLCK